MCVPRAQISDCLQPPIARCIMAALEPWVGGDIPPDVASHSTTTAVLNAGIEILTTSKDTADSTTPVKAVFESAIVILTLVRVRPPVRFPLSHPLIDNMTRMG